MVNKYCQYQQNLSVSEIPLINLKSSEEKLREGDREMVFGVKVQITVKMHCY